MTVDFEATPTLALAVAVVATSTSAILVRWSDAPSSVAALYRVLFTTVLVAPLAVTRHRGAFAALSRRDLAGAVLAGVALAVHFAAWFASLERTTVAASVTLVQSQPIFVALGAGLFLGERIGRGTVAGIAVTIVGATAMSLGSVGRSGLADVTLRGNALAVLGAITVAGYVLAGRSIRQRVPVLPYVTVVYGVCVVTLFLLVGVQGHSYVGYSLREWLLFLGLAVGPGIVGHTVSNWALEHLESVVVSVAWLGEPVGATLLALVLLSEVPDAITVIGGVVVIVGIAVTTLERESSRGVDVSRS
ncbi:DMT family transporter [Natrinema longum]|uniref:DMT family transporter n=1 Tax=Natrinema longum TaxID=370324 RepID=A0A8A2U8B9_9EURY|nr:DMT family transporter [Natrinema longum]MBZ6493830.1 DMT family transporter [Natrinema longum]QSW84833.1 DMT family transporter [Natrinema longum]